MKKAFALYLVAGLVLLFAACKSTGGITDPSMPPWINEQPPEDMLWGIGVASETQMTMRMTLADTRARADIARQMQTLVNNMVVDYSREAGGIDNTAALQFAETVTRNVSQANLSGAVRDVAWNTPDNKTLWVRIKLSKADAAAAAAAQVQKAIENEASRYAEFKAMDALKMMEGELQKYSSSPQPLLP